MTIRILTTGGTFDKVYYDAKGEFHFGDPIVGELLREANVSFAYEVESLMQKDSLDITSDDRQVIYDAVARASENRIMIIHGTDSMVETALRLLELSDRTIVLFGAMQPARMRYSDAMYNLGVACTAVQLLPAGVYIAMNGLVFDPREVRKNRAAARFETLDPGDRSPPAG